MLKDESVPSYNKDSLDLIKKLLDNNRLDDAIAITKVISHTSVELGNVEILLMCSTFAVDVFTKTFGTSPVAANRFCQCQH